MLLCPGKRRSLLASMPLVLFALPIKADAGSTPDFSDPATNIEIWAKLEGDTSGKTVYRVSRMTAYGVPRPGYSIALFALRSITKIEYRKTDAGYNSRWVSCAVYVGAFDDKVITQYANPFTGETIALKPMCSMVTGAKYTTDRGIEMEASFPLQSSIFGKPYVLDWQVFGDVATVDRVAHSEWKEPSSGKVKHEISIDSYTAKVADLADPAITNVDAAYSYTLVTEWLTSMNMGNRPGSILWKSNGRKLSNPDELPADLIADIEKVMPGRLAAPIKWADSNGR